VKKLGYGLEDRDLIPVRRRDIFSSSPRPDRPSCPPSLLANGYRV